MWIEVAGEWRQVLETASQEAGRLRTKGCAESLVRALCSAFRSIKVCQPLAIAIQHNIMALSRPLCPTACKGATKAPREVYKIHQTSHRVLWALKSIAARSCIFISSIKISTPFLKCKYSCGFIQEKKKKSSFFSQPSRMKQPIKSCEALFLPAAEWHWRKPSTRLALQESHNSARAVLTISAILFYFPKQ